MPRFVNQHWNDLLLRIVPSDNTRNMIRAICFRRDFIPYFYGQIKFDLGIAIPKKSYKLLQGKEIKYKWGLYTSEDNLLVKSGDGEMLLNSKKPFNYKKAQAGEVYHYGFEFTQAWFKYKLLRKAQTIDLGHVSKLDQYKVIMDFTDSQDKSSGERIMLEFTLQDLDVHTMTIIYLLLGAGIGFFGAFIGYIIGIN